MSHSSIGVWDADEPKQTKSKETMIRRIYLYLLHEFEIVISRKEAIRLGLTWRKNNSLDGIQYHKCGSYWKDEKGDWYKVREKES
jgi:hypothetical protein